MFVLKQIVSGGGSKFMWKQFGRIMVYISGQEISKYQNMGQNTLATLGYCWECLAEGGRQGGRSDNAVGVLCATLKSKHLIFRIMGGF